MIKSEGNKGPATAAASPLIRAASAAGLSGEWLPRLRAKRPFPGAKGPRC